MNNCSHCDAQFVPVNEMRAYAIQHGAESAYHWAIGAHTYLNDGKPPCSHCGTIYSFQT